VIFVVFQMCDILSSSKIVCTSPSIRHYLATSDHLTPTADKPFRISYGFMMDGVMSLRNMTHGGLLAGRKTGGVDHQRRTRAVGIDEGSSEVPKHLLVYPDPELDVFDGVKQFFYTKNEYLTINVSCALIAVHC